MPSFILCHVPNEKLQQPLNPLHFQMLHFKKSSSLTEKSKAPEILTVGAATSYQGLLFNICFTLF